MNSLIKSEIIKDREVLDKLIAAYRILRIGQFDNPEQYTPYVVTLDNTRIAVLKSINSVVKTMYGDDCEMMEEKL